MPYTLNNNFMKKTGIFIAIILILLYLVTQVTMNFTILAIVALVAIILPELIKYPKVFLEDVTIFNKTKQEYIPPIKDNKQGIPAIIFLFVFSMLTISTLNNYFYANEEVYTNNNNHIIRLDSITIDDYEGYILAGSNKEAFFDSKGFKGKVKIVSLDEEKIDSNKSSYSLKLELDGFSQPIYQNIDKEKKRRDRILNTNSLLSFNAGSIQSKDKGNSTPDIIKFVNNKKDSIFFWITERDGTKKWYHNIPLISEIKDYADTANYFFKIHRNETAVIDSSNITGISKIGHSFNSLIDGISADNFNFNGINIARAKTHPQSNHDERSDDGNTQYVLSLDSSYFRKNNDKFNISKISLIKGNEEIEYSPSSKDTITLNFNESLLTSKISIGYGKYKTAPFQFKCIPEKNKNKLQIVFAEPVCQELYSTNKKANNLYITSSIINYTEQNKKDINVPGNVLLFDIFDKKDNVNRFKPYNISFMSGHTTDNLLLLCEFDNDSIAIVNSNDYIAKKDTIAEKNTNRKTNKNICLGGENKECKIHWNFSLVNLREQTPKVFGLRINSFTLSLVVLLVAFLSILSTSMQLFYTSRYRNNFNRNTFSHQEYVLYIVLIFLVALRCFVIWRVMVFRPFENITQFELKEIIHQTTAFKGFLAGIVIFFATIIITKFKIYLSPRKEYNNNKYTTHYNTFTENLTHKEAALLTAANDGIYKKINNFFENLLLCKFTSLSLGAKFSITWGLLLIMAFVVYFVKERATIVLLVISYFYVDMMIYANNKYNTYKAEEIEKKDEKSHITSSFLYSILNMVLTMAFILGITKDSGFVIMFATFSLFAITFKLLDLYTKFVRSIGNKIYLIYFIILLAIIYVIVRYKKIIIEALYSSNLVLMIAVILSSVLFIVLYSNIIEKIKNLKLTDVIRLFSIIILPFSAIAIVFIYKDDINKIFTYCVASTVIVSILLLITSKGIRFIHRHLHVISANNIFVNNKAIASASDYFFNVKHLMLGAVFTMLVIGICFNLNGIIPANKLGGHTLQRINVQVYEPHEALLHIKNSGDEDRFLQASHNHWIIEQYYNRGQEVEPISDYEYFKMQPQSKVGAMWNAQVTDIVLLRYIIAEHGILLPVLILLLFLGMLYYGLKKTTYYRFTKSILIQIPLLILIQGILVWLANTQRFIFFGQDFPLLSVTSTFMVLYFFVLITIWVVAAIIESVMYRAYRKEDEYKAINDFNKKNSTSFLIVFCLAITIIALNKDIKSDTGSKYVMNELFNVAYDYVDHINKLFVEYQPEEGLSLRNNMHSVVNDFNDNYKRANKFDIKGNDYICLLHSLRTISDNSNYRKAIDEAYNVSVDAETRINTIENILNNYIPRLKDKETGKINELSDNYKKDKFIISGSLRDGKGINITSVNEKNVNYAYNILTGDTVVERISVESSIMRVKLEEKLKEYTSSAGEIDSILNKEKEEGYIFPLRIWRNYVKRGSYQNSYEGLIHIHRVNDDLRIAMRDTYYDVTLPNRNNIEWKGSIVEPYTHIPLSDTVAEKGNEFYTYYQIPASWVKEGETPHILTVKDTQNVELFSLENNTSISSGKGIEATLALHRDDNIRVNGKDVDTLPIERHNYWARNIRINGKQSFIYPQGKDLFWIWHFANAVKGQKDAFLRDSLQYYGNDALYANVEITLDKELTDKIFGVLTPLWKASYSDIPRIISGKRKDIQGTNDEDRIEALNQEIYSLQLQQKERMLSYSVIIADGNGHIQAMVNTKDDKYNINPNDNRIIGELNEMLYMNMDGDRNEQERYYFDNMSLTHMKGGPGSTQKPLVWTAVASNIRNLSWKDLVLKKKESDLLYYNGDKESKKMQKFHYSRFDEDVRVGTKKDMDLTNYLARSSNYYNAMMVYFGLQPYSCYEKKSFVSTSNISTERNANFVFKRALDENKWNSDYKERNYPFMKFTHNGNKLFTFGRQVTLDDYTESVLYKQFIERYKLQASLKPMVYHINNSKKDSILVRRYAKSLYKDYLMPENGNIGFTVPELSILNLKGYSDNMIDSLHIWSGKKEINVYENMKYANNGMRNITLGGNQMWVVTPFEMAQLYGKMVTLNSNYEFTLDPNNRFKNDTINIGKDNKEFQYALPVAYNSMNLFFTKGTGTTINNSDRTVSDNNGKVYYLYGKTGTSNEKKLINDKLATNEFRRLAIIISDTQLHQEHSENNGTVKYDKNNIPNASQNAKEAKFYVLYFTYDYVSSRLGDIATDVINEVVNSDTFQNYMNSDNK